MASRLLKMIPGHILVRKPRKGPLSKGAKREREIALWAVECLLSPAIGEFACYTVQVDSGGLCDSHKSLRLLSLEFVSGETNV